MRKTRRRGRIILDGYPSSATKYFTNKHAAAAILSLICAALRRRSFFYFFRIFHLIIFFGYSIIPIRKRYSFCWCGSMAEQLIRNEQVVSSILTTSSIPKTLVWQGFSAFLYPQVFLGFLPKNTTCNPFATLCNLFHAFSCVHLCSFLFIYMGRIWFFSVEK